MLNAECRMLSARRTRGARFSGGRHGRRSPERATGNQSVSRKRTLAVACLAVLATASAAWAQDAPSPADALRDLRGEPAGPATAAKPPPPPASRPTTQPTQPASAPSTRPAGSPPAVGGGGLFGAAGKLWELFGPVGVGSIAAWLAVWAVMAAFAFRTRGMPACLGASLLAGLAAVYVLSIPEFGQFVMFLLWVAVFTALGVVAAWALWKRQMPAAFTALILSLVAFGLGMWNSDNVLLFEEDRSAELAAARERQRKARQAQAEQLRAEDGNDVHFAGADGKAAATQAATRPADGKDSAAAAKGEYDYRKGGKKQRDPNKAVKGEILTAVVDAADEAGQADGPRVKLVSGADYVLVNQLDRINRFAVRLTLVVALLLAGVEYLRRFNLTFGSIFPVPIAGPAVDAIWPKTHSVYLHTAGGEAVRQYLETAVHKGESFICIAPADPWPDGRRRLGRLPAGRWLWSLGKIACPPGDPRFDSRFVFESAWYGRYAFVILCDGVDEALRGFLRDLEAAVRMRRHTRATARRTVNIVWHMPQPMPPDHLERLVRLCPQTNLKLLVASDQAPDAQARERFDEMAATG